MVPISTGSLGLDLATGIGGFPRGRVVEVFGADRCGQVLGLHAIASVQRQGDIAAMIDVEHTLDAAILGGFGIDDSRLLVSQPDCGEQALEIAERLVRSNAVSLIVVDSVAGLVPEADLSGGTGLHARMMSRAVRKITEAATCGGCCVVFLNSIVRREGATFGSWEVASGGNALKFYSSMRMMVRRLDDDRIHVRVVKNKLAMPFHVAEFGLVDGRVDRLGELVALGSAAGVIVEQDGVPFFDGAPLDGADEGTLGRIAGVIAQLRDQAGVRAGVAGEGAGHAAGQRGSVK